MCRLIDDQLCSVRCEEQIDQFPVISLAIMCALAENRRLASHKLLIAAAAEEAILAPETHNSAHSSLEIHDELTKEQSPAEFLRKADLLFESLQRILKPTADILGGPVNFCVKDSKSVESGAQDQHEDHDVVVLSPDELQGAWIKAETRSLLQRWYGEPAGSARTVVCGIAGYASARCSLGPTTLEADTWVRSELAAGRKVCLAVREEDGQDAACLMSRVSSEAYSSAATSFVAFLFANYGREKLVRYLAQYDSSRKDQSSEIAFHHPLAVLEEEWLARLSHHANAGDTFRAFIRQILPLVKPYKWKQIEIFVYLVLAGGYNIVQPYAIKVFVDRLSRQLKSGGAISDTGRVFSHLLAPFLLLLLCLYVLNGIVSLRRAYTVNWLNQNVLNTLQVRMYAHMQRLAHSFYLKAKTGDLMTRLNEDLDNVQSALSQVTNKALYQVFTLIGATVALVILTHKSPILAVSIMCILPLFAINYAALRTRNKQASREQRRRVGQTMADVQQHLIAHAVIKAFGMEDKTISDYRSQIKGLQQSKLRLALLSALTDLSEDTATALAQLVIFGVGGYLVIRDGGHGLGVGDLAALLVLVKSIFSPVASLAGIGQTMQQATGALERVSELFNEPVTIFDKPGAVPLPLLSLGVHLDKVTFLYGGDRKALSDATITIPAGKHVAIVGPSGSGKSSAVNLLMRFWDPEEGLVRFDGHDLRDVTLASLRDQIGLVFQDTFIFDTTLRDNIGIGRPAATDAEISEAAKAAQIHEFIVSLPDGYDTIPGENGSRLSGGQRQRIAIARAYLRNPRLLILDEATSALDMQTEAGILETLKGLVKDRTTISVTHRIAQAACADLIIVLDAGKVVQQGTHASLMSEGGLYQKLYAEATGTTNSGA